MADNKTLPPTGTGTADIVVATDEIVGVDYQKVKLVDGTADSTAVIPGDATNGLDVDVTRLPAPLTVTGSGTEAAALRVTLPTDSTGVITVKQSSSVNLKAQVGGFAADGAALTGNPVLVAGSDGTNAQSLSVDASGELQVDVLTLPNVTLAAGTNTQEVVGDVAHDAAAAGNPVLNAGVAQDMDDTAPPNRVNAEGDAVRLAADRDGTMFVHPYGPQVWSYHEDSSSALTDATVHAAPGAGLSLYVTDIIISTGAATALNVFFEEGASKVLGPYYLEAVAGRGTHLRFGTPKKITANTALTITTSAAIAHSIDITGFVAQG